jgi:hypothetical protein
VDENIEMDLGDIGWGGMDWIGLTQQMVVVSSHRDAVAMCSWLPVLIICYSVYQNLSGGLGGAFFVQGSRPTLADLLQSIPDHSYTEGESIFADLAMTVVSQYCSIN